MGSFRVCIYWKQHIHMPEIGTDLTSAQKNKTKQLFNNCVCAGWWGGGGLIFPLSKSSTLAGHFFLQLYLY